MISYSRSLALRDFNYRYNVYLSVDESDDAKTGCMIVRIINCPNVPSGAKVERRLAYSGEVKIARTLIFVEGNRRTGDSVRNTNDLFFLFN